MSFEVNRRITECRKKAKMTKKEVAQRLDMKYTTYCRMEEKAKRITNDEVERIAKVIGADKNYILYGMNEDPFAPLEPKVVVIETPKKGALPFDFGTPAPPTANYKDGDFSCSSEERALIRLYRGYSWENKQKVREFLQNLK